MEVFKKELEDFSEEDFLKIEADPLNFESFNIEYKLKYDGDADELRRDVIQFFNGNDIGFLIFGMSNNPIKIHGLEKAEIDSLKNVLNNVLPQKIDPILSPFPEYKVVNLSNGKFILIIKILPKQSGIYGIRLHNNPSNRNFLRYEFYRRMDGSKHQMSIEEIVALIENKGTGKKKIIEATIHGGALLPTLSNDLFIAINAVNKSERPITVKSYGIDIVSKNKKIVISPFHPKTVMTCSPLPSKLEDGDDCKAFLSRREFEEFVDKNGWEYPIKIRSYFGTNDGDFFSEILELDKFYK